MQLLLFFTFFFSPTQERQMLNKKFCVWRFFFCCSTATRHPTIGMLSVSSFLFSLFTRGLDGWKTRKGKRKKAKAMQQCTENHSDFALWFFLLLFMHTFLVSRQMLFKLSKINKFQRLEKWDKTIKILRVFRLNFLTNIEIVKIKDQEF